MFAPFSNSSWARRAPCPWFWLSSCSPLPLSTFFSPPPARRSRRCCDLQERASRAALRTDFRSARDHWRAIRVDAAVVVSTDISSHQTECPVLSCRLHAGELCSAARGGVLFASAAQ